VGTQWIDLAIRSTYRNRREEQFLEVVSPSLFHRCRYRSSALARSQTFQIPLVKLDDAHYKLVDQLEALVEAPPSLLDAVTLTVKGPVKFSPGIDSASHAVIDGHDELLDREARVVFSVQCVGFPDDVLTNLYMASCRHRYQGRRDAGSLWTHGAALGCL